MTEPTDGELRAAVTDLHDARKDRDNLRRLVAEKKVGAVGGELLGPIRELLAAFVGTTGAEPDRSRDRVARLPSFRRCGHLSTACRLEMARRRVNELFSSPDTEPLDAA